MKNITCVRPVLNHRLFVFVNHVSMLVTIVVTIILLKQRQTGITVHIVIVVMMFTSRLAMYDAMTTNMNLVVLSAIESTSIYERVDYSSGLAHDQNKLFVLSRT